MKKTLLIFLAVVILIAAFILIVYQVKMISGTQSESTSDDISKTAVLAYTDNCARCHGNAGEGVGTNPAIADNGYSADHIKVIIQSGLPSMSAFPNIKDPVLTELATLVSQL